ncbi:MAG: glycosyltransferase family 9 protein [Veillonellaceae bacterium]|nr:glycosyltransferase family 9 protein [Veillonellaceae bacterium]
MASSKRFVIVRLSSIGDVLHCTPVARALKEKFPTCHITWIVGQVSFPMLEANPYIDEVYIWSRERWEKLMRQGKLTEAWQMWRQLKRDMAEREFDVALDIHGLFLSGLVTKATGAPRRIGLSGNKEPNGLFMTEQVPALPQDVHVIQRYLSILRPFGINTKQYDMTLCLTDAAKNFAAKFLNEHNITPEDKLVIINPATTWLSKNWPAEFFASTADSLAVDAKLILCGGPGDRTLADKVLACTKASIIDAVGKTSLLEMAALLGRANLLIVGDTGPLHMAVALGVPTVSVFGPTDPARFGPLPRGHVVFRSKAGCMPCHKTVCSQKDMRCMRSMRPEIVVSAARRILNGRGGL